MTVARKDEDKNIVRISHRQCRSWQKKSTPDAHGVRIAELNELKYRKQLWNHRPLTDFWRVGRGYVIIPGLSEPPVRTLRAIIPENESHIFR